MTTKRHISLYYGSISINRSFKFILSWVQNFFRSNENCRKMLHEYIKVTYYSEAAGIYSYGSARSALASFLESYGIKKGDEVILSAYTCLAVPTAILAAGGTPVYVDINSDTLNIEIHGIQKCMSPKVKAIIIQHTLGKIANVKEIVDFAQSKGIVTIEDCALSLGSRINGKLVGSFADATILSMELSKTLSIGWGGILVVNNVEIDGLVKKNYNLLNEKGRVSASKDLWQTVISAISYHPSLYHILGKYVLFVGFATKLFRKSTPANEFLGLIADDFILKMSGLQASIALEQWKEAENTFFLTNKNATHLRKLLSRLNIEIPGIPAQSEYGVAPRVSFYTNDRSVAVDYFMERGIELGQWFDGPLSPVPTNPLFNYLPGQYPLAESVAMKIVNLPCHSRITVRDLGHMENILKNFIAENPANIVIKV
jgi:perosamine synthetase